MRSTWKARLAEAERVLHAWAVARQTAIDRLGRYAAEDAERARRGADRTDAPPRPEGTTNRAVVLEDDASSGHAP